MHVPSILVFRWIEVPSPERSHAKMLAFRESDDMGTVFLGNAAYHRDLAEHIGVYVEDQTLCAAGDVNKFGEVTSWKSSGFSFETPSEIRPEVAAFLREHQRDIEELWAQ